MTFKEYIKSRGESINSISKKMGVPYSTLHDCIENPKHMKLENVKKASRLFGVSIEFLVSLIDPDDPSLLSYLLEQQNDGCTECLCSESQVLFTYNNNAIEGHKLSYDDVNDMYISNKLSSKKREIDIDDIIEIVNSFYLFDEMLKTADYSLTIDLIERYHRIFLNGTKDARDTCFVGGYSRLKKDKWADVSPMPKEKNRALRQLLNEYHLLEKIILKDIVTFHQEFLKIEPFEQGSRRVGRLILFKECLMHQIVPFVFSEKEAKLYQKSLRDNDKLMALVKDAQSRYRSLLTTHLNKSQLEELLTYDRD